MYGCAQSAQHSKQRDLGRLRSLAVPSLVTSPPSLSLGHLSSRSWALNLKGSFPKLLRLDVLDPRAPYLPISGSGVILSNPPDPLFQTNAFPSTFIGIPTYPSNTHKVARFIRACSTDYIYTTSTQALKVFRPRTLYLSHIIGTASVAKQERHWIILALVSPTRRALDLTCRELSVFA